jgi:hypothetical protein
MIPKSGNRFSGRIMRQRKTRIALAMAGLGTRFGNWRAAWLGLFLTLISAMPATAQVGFDRWGGDYQSAPLRSGDPAACAARCERDPRCRAWAFSYPATESPNAMCWLKSRVTARVPASCCVSGVRGAGVIEPQGGPIEFAIDRVGGDYRHFELPPDHTGKACQLA